jgi:hypothetical protein
MIRSKGMEAGITNLNVLLTGLHLPETENDSLRLEHLALAYDKLQVLLKEKKMNVVTGAMKYEYGNLTLRDITWQQNTSGGKKRLRMDAVSVTGFNSDRLIYGHELIADSLLVSGPRLSGDFIIPEKKDDEPKAAGVINIPLAVRINYISVEHGKTNSTVTYQDEPVKIGTGYKLNLWGLDVAANDTLQDVMNRLRWQIELNDLELEAADHLCRVNYLLTDSYQSRFYVNDLSVNSLPGSDTDTTKVKIKSLVLPSVLVKGLDYSLLIAQDSVSFSTLQIDTPYVDLVLPVVKDTLKKQEGKHKFRPQDYLVFSYDTVELTNLNLKIEKKGPDNNEFISLKDFYFSHFKDDSREGNLIEDLVFNFRDFRFYDSISQRHISIRDGVLDSDKGILFIKGIKGSNTVIGKEGSIDFKKPGVNYIAEEIELVGITVRKTLPTQISARKLRINDINLDIVQKPSDTVRGEEFKIDLDIMKKLEHVLTSLQLDTAVLSDISFNIHTLSDTAEGHIRIDSIGVVVEKIQVDSSMAGEVRPDIINKITIDLKGKTQITEDSLYELRTGRLHYNFREQTIIVDSFFITPLFEPEEFFKRAVYQTDRVDFFSRKIEIDNININELLSSDHLHVSDIRIYEAKTEMYRDKHYPLKPGIYKPLPRELLMSIKKAFTVDSVHITDSYLKYLEMDAKADDPGEVYFNQFNVTAYNLTNHIKEGEKKDLIVDLHTRIMGQSMMDLNIRFPLYPDTIAFRMTGKTEKIDLTTLNPLTRNLLGIGITKGKGSVDISYISGNDSVAKGALIFKYKKLRLLPYNRKKEKLRKNVLTPLVSFMINDLVVKSNNPRFARKPRVGEVYFKRDTQKSIVNYVWKSVLSGLMSTMGFNNKAQRQERKEERKK